MASGDRGGLFNAVVSCCTEGPLLELQSKKRRFGLQLQFDAQISSRHYMQRKPIQVRIMLRHRVEETRDSKAHNITRPI
jgi:hypothetical protein